MPIRCDDSDGSQFEFLNIAALRNDPLSMMMWINNYTGGGDEGGGGTYFSIWTGSTRAWRITASSGPLEYRARISTTGSNQLSLSSNTTISLDTWYLVGMDYDGTDINFWLNGALDAGPGNQPGGLFASSEDLAVNGQSTGGNQPDSDTADSRIYNRILSAEEWETIYAARGHDGITAGLIMRSEQAEGSPGTLLSSQNPEDISESQLIYGTEYGSPVPSYIAEGPGLSFRRRV